MKNYIVTFGFQENGEFVISNSKVITEINEEEAELKLKKQFESLEGTECVIIITVEI